MKNVNVYSISYRERVEGDDRMSKHKKNKAAAPKAPLTAAPEKPFSAKSDFPEIENHLASDNGKTLGKAKREISGIWVLIFLLGLLILLVVQHWLRQ